MALAPWRAPLARALHRNRSRPDSRYLQLATMDRDGYPANRTVVFRGFFESGDRPMLVSDTRSAKIEQIQANPAAEVCWYFAKTREQFRLRGELTVVTAETEPAELRLTREQLWHNLSDAARQQFTWPSPGQPRQEQGFAIAPPNSTQPPPHFCLILLEPNRVDYLALRGEPQDRIIYTRQGQDPWQAQGVNP
ncbi:MAG: pyridoxamine 5'-phosphate oxidase family protein [Cyanobacteria bacterium]|nr:pyridoxamine 5'-phosphate oxidase family protein [Cyanobacteriota bacterium]